MVANVEMANQIAVGTVSSLTGTVKAISLDGSERILQAGDQVHADDVLITGASASVSIKFNNGSTLDLASDARASLDSDVYGGTTAEDAAASVEAVQQAIAEGQDPTATLPAPGAGIAGSEGGHGFVRVDLIDQRVDPENGFETEGLSFNVERPEEELLFIQPREEEPQEPTIPAISISDATAIESDPSILAPPSPPPSSGGFILQTFAVPVVIGDYDSKISFDVTLDQASAETITVDYVVVDNDATNPGDYNYPFPPFSELSGSITFNPGETLKTITIDVTDDFTPENTETFFVRLQNPSSNATIADGEAIGTIIDNDPLPTVNVEAVTSDEEHGVGYVMEGDPGDNTVFVFKVSLDSVSSQTVTIGYEVKAGSAKPDMPGTPYDYNDGLSALSGTITFNPGETEQLISIDITEDTLTELRHGGQENFTLNLLDNAVNATRGIPSAKATIIDDDTPLPLLPTVNVEAVTSVDGYGIGYVMEGDPGDNTVFVFKVSLDSASSQTVTIGYEVKAGSAKPDMPGTPYDYNDGLSALSGTITFNPGETEQLISIDITEDTLTELRHGGQENFTLNLLDNAVNATRGIPSAKATIIDDDPTVTITSVNAAPVAVEDTKEVTEDALPNPVEGNVLLNDTDVDNVLADFSVTGVTSNNNGGAAVTLGVAYTGEYGSFTLNADGTYSYTLDNGNAAVDTLNVGDSLTETFTYTMTDGDQSSSNTLTITINGANDIVVNNQPEADPVLTIADSAPAGIDASLGDVIYFKALEVGSGLDGGIPVYESPVSDLGGADTETAENALVFTLNSLPEYGTLYIDLNADDATGASWTAMSAGDTFSTADALYWVATSTDTIGNIGDISPIIGGTTTLADWTNNSFVTFSGRSQGGVDFLENNLAIINDSGFSGGFGLGVPGGSRKNEIDYNRVTGESEALKIAFADAITAMTINFSLFYGGEGISGELAQITAYDAVGNIIGTTTVAGDPGKVYGKNSPGDVSHTVSFGGAGFTSLILEPQPFDSGVNNDSSDFAIKSIDLTPGIVQFDYTVTDSEGMTSDMAPVVIDLNGEPTEFVVDGQLYKIGSAGSDILVGQSGDEIISGNAGADSIFGKGGNDILDGGDDNDIIYGGTGDDTLTGGNGVDNFIWIAGDGGTEATPAVDTITDFVTGVGGDVINLDDLLPAAVNDSTPNLDSYLNFALVSGNTEIQIDPDGTGGTTQTIILEGIDLVTGNTNTQIITQLVNDGNLII